MRALEIKLSQGAKPGLGGVLPGAKVSAEIAATRGVPEGVDCISPSRHAEFSDADSLLDWVELLAAETGLPVGIKSAVGDMGFWDELTDLMAQHRPGRRLRHHRRRRGRHRRRAADLHRLGVAALPARLRPGLLDLRREQGLHEQVVFIGAGKLGLPDNAIVAFALGCDMVNVAREAMLAIGCIQAQKCHTDTCPTGVATQNAWLAHGLDPALKSVRAANYIKTLRRDLLKVAEACGVEHPGLIDTDAVEILDGRTAPPRCTTCTATSPGGASRRPPTGPPSDLMTATEPQGGAAPPSATAVG